MCKFLQACVIDSPIDAFEGGKTVFGITLIFYKIPTDEGGYLNMKSLSRSSLISFSMGILNVSRTLLK